MARVCASAGTFASPLERRLKRLGDALRTLASTQHAHLERLNGGGTESVCNIVPRHVCVVELHRERNDPVLQQDAHGWEAHCLEVALGSPQWYAQLIEECRHALWGRWVATQGHENPDGLEVSVPPDFSSWRIEPPRIEPGIHLTNPTQLVEQPMLLIRRREEEIIHTNACQNIETSVRPRRAAGYDEQKRRRSLIAQ